MDKVINSDFMFNSVVEAVNYFTGKEYKAWMKGSYPINEDFFLWFPHFSVNGKPLKGGWIDEIINNEIHEYNKDSTVSVDWSGKHPKYRIVIGTMGLKPPYRFYGVYERNDSKSTKHENVYVKVIDSLNLSELQ